MPLWMEPELCLEYKGVQVYREYPNRFVCFTRSGARDVPLHHLLGSQDPLATLKLLIDREELS